MAPLGPTVATPVCTCDHAVMTYTDINFVLKWGVKCQMNLHP